MSVKTEIHADTQQAQVNIKKFTDALEKLNKQGGNTSEALKNISKHAEATSNNIKTIAKNTNTLTDKLAHSAQAINGWIEIGKGVWNNVGKAFIQTADAINTMNARLKLVSTSGAHFEALKNSINEIARATSSSTDSMVTLL